MTLEERLKRTNVAMESLLTELEGHDGIIAGRLQPYWAVLSGNINVVKTLPTPFGDALAAPLPKG
eukprot:6860136-Lingulodinium_polyedra.AAC.1